MGKFPNLRGKQICKARLGHKRCLGRPPSFLLRESWGKVSPPYRGTARFEGAGRWVFQASSCVRVPFLSSFTCPHFLYTCSLRLQSGRRKPPQEAPQNAASMPHKCHRGILLYHRHLFLFWIDISLYGRVLFSPSV